MSMLLLYAKPSSMHNYAISVPTGAKGVYGVAKVNGWTGNSFQVTRASDNATFNIGFAANGLADWFAADVFALGTTYSISKLYDMSGNGYDFVPNIQAPIQWGNTVNGIRSITFNSGGVDQQLINTILPITDVRNMTIMWAGQAAYGQSSGGIYEIGNPTDKLWIGSLTDNGAVNNDNLNKGQVCNPMVHLYVSNGAANVLTKMNDLSFATTAKTSSPATGITLGNAFGGGTSFPGRCEMLSFIIYDSTLSAGNQTALTDAAYNAFGINRISSNDVLLWLGDSLTIGTIGPNDSYQFTWNQQIQANFKIRAYTYFNMARSGQLASEIDNTATLFATETFAAGKICVCELWGGTNDLAANVSVATVYASLKSAAAKVRAAGFSKVSIKTILPRNAAFSNGQTAGGFEIARLALNGLIRAGIGTDFDYLEDVGADAIIGQLANLNTTYFFDLLHQAKLGHTYTYPYSYNFLVSVG